MEQATQEPVPARKIRIGRLVVGILAAAAVVALAVIVMTRNSDDDSASSSKSPRSGSTESSTTQPPLGSPPLSAEGPAVGTLQITAGPDGSLSFAPTALNAGTGVYRVTIDVATGGHDFTFLARETLFRRLVLSDAGSQVSGRVFFPRAGDYRFACLVPGHRGMSGVVHVSGPDTTLDQALAAAAATPTSAP